ncbi:MAG: undecaprenyl/decaprenyl-phosphate alpha-N-acetylglucosaminyl 1-phosphate transferase [Candidatus Eremiobacteraeota bacterium]|nr:undecaprenyl/decaprenyl-phosphate alpha-N-acetylglucosaminyl 1-phosphate transferase [Candidatus Eremiobacteraeota bacterium]
MSGAWLYISALVISASTSALLTPMICRLANHVGMLDKVEDDRRVHENPTPRLGGIAVYIGFTFALFAVLGLALTRFAFFHSLDDIHAFLGLLFGSTLILGVGLWDDIMGMTARSKLFAQIVVALISMAYGFVISFVHNPFGPGYIYFPWWISWPLTLVWYVGMMNAINFIDGLDGLLTGVTAISTMSLFAIALLHHDPVVALVVIALAGASLGFLPYNFNPAKIFLGDSGSLFIGFVFATVSVIGEGKVAISISLIVPLMILALPIIDTAAAIIRRTRSGKKITEADRGHFHHQLIFRYGLNVRQAVILIYVLCFLLGVTALLLSGAIPHFSKLAA